MRFSIECKVESKIKIPKEISIKHKDREYILYPDENKLLTRIKIIADVMHPEKFYSTIKSYPTEDVKHSLKINQDRELFDSIIKDFQQLESRLSFNGNLRRFLWNELSYDVICDSVEEEQMAKIVGTYSFKSEYLDRIFAFDENDFLSIIATKEKYAHLTIPMAFLREGKNDYDSFRYINAFYNFYFILEWLYGGGKTKNYAVEEEFKKSNEFCESVEVAIDTLIKAPRHNNNINVMLNFRSKKLDIDGITHLLVRTRGDLHHFSGNSNKTQGTPFNHKEFESIAWVSLFLANAAINLKILEINMQSED